MWNSPSRWRMSAHVYDSETRAVGEHARKRLAELEAEETAAASLDDSPSYPRLVYLRVMAWWDRHEDLVLFVTIVAAVAAIIFAISMLALVCGEE